MDIKYLQNGQMVNLKQIVEDGFIVNPIRTIDGKLTVVNSRSKFVKIVLDFPPVTGIALELENKKADLEKIKVEYEQIKQSKIVIENEIKKIGEEAKQTFAFIEQWQELKMLRKFLEGKINFALAGKYGSWKILDIKELLKNNDKYTGEFKLVTLFGTTNGDMQWGIDQYRDHINNYEKAYFFETYEETVSAAQEIINNKESIDKYDIELAIAHKIKVKSFLLESFLEKSMRSNKEERDGYQKNIEYNKNQESLILDKIRSIEILEEK